MKQMMDNFPYELLRKSVKSHNDKKTKTDADADVNSDALVSQINLSLIQLYLDLSTKPSSEFFAKIVSYLKGKSSSRQLVTSDNFLLSLYRNVEIFFNFVQYVL